jgi:hypothetical protein
VLVLGSALFFFAMSSWWSLLLAASALLPLASPLYFHIAETERKCFIEEIPDETMVIGMCASNLESWVSVSIQHLTFKWFTCYGQKPLKKIYLLLSRTGTQLATLFLNFTIIFTKICKPFLPVL